MAAVVLGNIAWATARGRRAVGRKGIDWKGRWMTTASELIPPTLLRLAVAEMTVIRTALFRWGGHRRSLLKKRGPFLRVAFRLDDLEPFTPPLAGVALDHRTLVDDRQLVAVPGDRDLLARDDTDDRERRALGLPAFGAAARMVVRDVAVDRHRDGAVGAMTAERTAGEIAGAGGHAVIEHRVEGYGHGITPCD